MLLTDILTNLTSKSSLPTWIIIHTTTCPFIKNIVSTHLIRYIKGGNIVLIWGPSLRFPLKLLLSLADWIGSYLTGLRCIPESIQFGIKELRLVTNHKNGAWVAAKSRLAASICPKVLCWSECRWCQFFSGGWLCLQNMNVWLVVVYVWIIAILDVVDWIIF